MARLRTRQALVLLAAGAGAGCGGAGDDAATGNPPSASRDRPLVVRIEGAGGPSGPPDAGTATGHGADVVLRADGPVAEVRGRVDPPDATVRLTGPEGTTAARVGPGGRFVGRVGGLRRAANPVRIEARREGAVGWTREIRIVRR